MSKKTGFTQSKEMNTLNREFPAGSVVGTPCFHCSRPEFSPWSGNCDPAGRVAKNKKEILNDVIGVPINIQQSFLKLPQSVGAPKRCWRCTRRNPGGNDVFVHAGSLRIWISILGCSKNINSWLLQKAEPNHPPWVWEGLSDLLLTDKMKRKWWCVMLETRSLLACIWRKLRKPAAPSWGQLSSCVRGSHVWNRRLLPPATWDGFLGGGGPFPCPQPQLSFHLTAVSGLRETSWGALSHS